MAQTSVPATTYPGATCYCAHGMLAAPFPSSRRAEECQDGEYSPMGSGVRVEAEFAEDLRRVGFDRPLDNEQAVGDGGVRQALGDQRKDLAFAAGQVGERVLVAPAADEPGDDCRVDDALAVVDPAESIDQDGRVENPLLEQVADSFGAVLDKPHGIARLDVLGQDQHADAGMVGLNPLR